MNDHTTVEYHSTEPPACDFCGEPALYDFATKQGSWAYGCQLHYESHNAGGLGLGRGQRLTFPDK